MKILGIGNAIVDVICKIDDGFLNKHGLTKGTMKLVDEDEFKKLLKKQKKSNKYVTIFFGKLNLKNNRILNISFVTKKKLGNAVKRNKIKIVYSKGKKSAPKQATSDHNYNEDKNKRQKKVDAILDKIKASGYESLSKEEKDYLFDASKNI